jgi:hypothetical protein
MLALVVSGTSWFSVLIAGAVTIIFEVFSHWRGLLKDKCDRHFLMGFIALTSGLLLPIVGDQILQTTAMILALIYFMKAWDAKRKPQPASMSSEASMSESRSRQ